MDKQALRERIWDELEESGAARFPFPPHGRIPNFDGAREAADRLADTEAWQRADAIKSNPDSPQRFVRERALADGKTVYMAVPRLAEEQPFLRLDPERIDDPSDAATLSGADEYGVPVDPGEVGPIDLIVSGSVAMTERGARVGKGEGYSDLEFAVLLELGAIEPDVPVVTTVHERQVVDEDVPIEAHDVALDLVVTPERTVETDRAADRPTGIDWAALSAERIAEMPVLERLQP